MLEKALRRILGPKGKQITGGWRKLQNGEFNNLYFSLNRPIKL
jgi:hypothetical protein